MLGFQLWCAKGWDGIILKTATHDSGPLLVEDVEFVEPYPDSQWSRMLDLEELDVAQLELVVEGTLVAFESQKVRTINPFQFLEIGLQTAFHHPRVGALLWTMGLDALLAAEKQKRFASRLVRLLGEQTLVFPRDGVGRQPSYTVGEVATKMYDLRNLIAHGKEVLEDYRKPIRVDFVPSSLSYLTVENWTFETLLAESSLFTLTAALRKVILEGLLEKMADKSQWEQWLDSP